jgi:hypothetical protein
MGDLIMEGLDGKTERYLARIASEIGYIYRDYSDQPTEELFAKKDVPLYHCRKIKIEEEKFATIYNFPANVGEFASRLNQNTSQADEDEFHYAADWPVQTDSGYVHHTFLFDTLPQRSDIKTARHINKVWKQIDCNELKQYFTCRVCSQRTHWTETEGSADEETDIFRERVMMLENQICDHSTLERESSTHVRTKPKQKDSSHEEVDSESNESEEARNQTQKAN